MQKLEFNKIIASILLPILAIILISKLVNYLYYQDSYQSKTLTTVSEHRKIINPSASSNQELSKIDILNLVESGSIERGKMIAKRCISCHSFEKNQPNRIGPNLFNIFNKPKATVANYRYSQAMLGKVGIWDEHELFQFLKNPSKYVVGTKMVFPGIKKNHELADLISFMKSNVNNQNSLPKQMIKINQLNK